MNIQQKEKGFTIIEVVLVLAIAGLIFMMVFIALPSLQRSQRDAQRKNDLSRAITALTSYASNNRGALPTFDANFISSYLTVGNDSFIDPSGANTNNTTASTYTFTASGTGAQAVLPAPTGTAFSDNYQNVIYYTTSATCGNSGDTVKSGNRKVALRMYLESGGIACQNN